MNPPKPTLGLFCVCDPDGNFDHTSARTIEGDAISEFMAIEGAMCQFKNYAVLLRSSDEMQPEPSWEQYQAKGYRCVPVKLIPDESDGGSPAPKPGTIAADIEAYKNMPPSTKALITKLVNAIIDSGINVTISLP